MTVETPRPFKVRLDEAATVSDETKAIVEQNLPNESDEVKEKFGELIDAIKRQATREIESVETMSRETYVQAIENAQQTLNRAQTFLQAQEEALEQNVTQVKDDASQKWESVLADIKTMGDRVDRAINAAWMILTESEQ
jgi:L-lactate utilization protein LutC